MLIAAASVVPLIWGIALVRPYIWGSGESTAVPLDEVVKRFDAATTVTTATTDTVTTDAAPDAPAAVMPEPGVYTYATSGGDSVDALSGDAHTYPAITTMTVLASGCGTVQRWDVLVQRWQAAHTCVRDAGVATDRIVNFDSFFERGQTDTYECVGDVRPLDAPEGTTWSFVCAQNGRDDRYSGVVVGTETRQVGTSTVAVLHVRVSIDNGNPVDSQITDSWYLLGADLLVARTAVNETTNDSPIGAVHYSERYELMLTSVDPL